MILFDYLNKLINQEKDEEKILDNEKNDKNENENNIIQNCNDKDKKIQEKIISKILCIFIDLMFTDLMEKDIKKQFLDLIKSIDITSEILDDIIQEIKKIFYYFYNKSYDNKKDDKNDNKINTNDTNDFKLYRDKNKTNFKSKAYSHIFKILYYSIDSIINHKNKDQINEGKNQDILEKIFELLLNLFKEIGEDIHKEKKEEEIVLFLSEFLKFMNKIIFNDSFNNVTLSMKNYYIYTFSSVLNLCEKELFLNSNILLTIKINEKKYQKTVTEIIFDDLMKLLLNDVYVDFYDSIIKCINSIFKNIEIDKKRHTLFYYNDYFNNLLNKKKLNKEDQKKSKKMNLINEVITKNTKNKEQFQMSYTIFSLIKISAYLEYLHKNQKLIKYKSLCDYLGEFVEQLLEELKDLYKLNKNIFAKESNYPNYNHLKDKIEKTFISLVKIDGNKTNDYVLEIKKFLETEISNNSESICNEIIFGSNNNNNNNNNNDNNNINMKRSKTSKIINDPYIDNLNSKQKRTTIVTKNNSSLEKLNYRKTINIYSINAPSLTLEDSTIGRYSSINDFHDLYEKEKEDEILKNINISDYINSIYFFEVIDNDYISNNKKYLMNTIFSLYFIDAFFKNELFEKMKNYYLNNYNNVKIGTKNLNYPSKYKNYNNGLEPGMFLKQYNNFYNNKYFPISHPYFINYMNDKHLYSKYIKLYPREIPNSLDIIKPADFRTNVELIGINKYYFGEILAYCSNNKEKYLLFQEKVFNLDCEYENLLDDTKNENIEFIFSLSFLINHEKLKFKKKDEKNNDEQKKTQKKRNNKTIIILFSEIEEIIERRFLLMWQGVEIFLKNGKSYFFNAYNENNKKDFLDFLKNYKELTKLMHMKDFLCTEKEITKKWKEYHFSTYEYLLLVNKYSSRSFNDNSQYPIFPWLLIKDLYNLETINEKDYLTEEYLKKKSKIKEEDENYNYLKFLRQLNYPVCIQKIETIKKMIKKYIDSDEKYKNHLCIHYSTSSYVYYYLMRQEPYSDLMIKLQNYQQENPNRMFSDIEESLKTLETGKDSREIIPEFFSRIEFLINLNCEYFGMKTNKTIVDDIIINCLEENEKINPFFQYIHFIIEHKKLLNSKIISIHIDEWIDNIFGINQIPAKKKDRENSCNIFFKSSYEKLYNLQKKLNKCIDKIKEYEKENKEKNNTSDIIKYKNKLIFKYN